MKKIGIIMLSVLVLTGCVQQINLTEEESDTIASYAAYVTLQYDKNYGRKLVDTAEPTEEVDTKSKDVENTEGVLAVSTSVQDNQVQAAVVQEEPTEVEQVTDLASVFGLDGFKIVYEDLVYAKKYKDIDRGFVANSSNDNLFLILKFKVENVTDETKTCDIASKSPRFRVSVNGSAGIDTYSSIISNDLAALNSQIDANSSKDAVLLLEVPQEYENSISNLSLEAIMDGKASAVQLNK